MKIVCVAVVGKSNNPLYIRSFEPLPTSSDANNNNKLDLLKFHYIVHTSLDVVEEKVPPISLPQAQPPPPATSKQKAASSDLYLGLLCPTEDYKVYGYITNTRNKLIVVVDDYDVREADVKSFFRGFHSIFSDAVSNPFYTPDEKISSRKFERDVVALVKSKSPESS